MTERQQRRLQQKIARKAQKLEQRSNNNQPLPQQPISERKLAANRANAQLSCGPTSTTGKQIVSQNRTRHGLTGDFHVMTNECQADFDHLTDTLIREYAPADETEAQFIHQMSEALWLSNRSVRLQDGCLVALESGDEEQKRIARKDLALFLRYQSAHERAFVRYSTELRKRRNERRRVERGFESQKAREGQEARRKVQLEFRQAAENRKQERHEAQIRLTAAKCERLEARKNAAAAAA